MKRNSIFYGALLLTLGSIALRVVQMLFQIYISGVMGAEGLGRMQLVSTIGAFAAILASGGVRIAATCLTAEEVGRGNLAGVKSAVRCCCMYGLALSIPVGIGLFLMADYFAITFIAQPEGALSLRIFALFLPISTLWAVFAGYFTADGRVGELVALEFFERILSIVIVVVGLRVAVLDPCAMILLGSSLATTASFFLLVRRYSAVFPHTKQIPMGEMMPRLLRLTIPLGLNDILKSGLNTVENILVPQGLRKGGASNSDALSAYGTICGMVFPVITFPSVILYSLSDLLVPEMAKCRARERTERMRFLTDKCLRLTMVFAMSFAGLGLLLGEELGVLLFDSPDAGRYIRIFSPLVIMLYLDAITDGMLKGLSQQIYTVRYNTITSLLDVTLLFFLLPRYGIGGYLFSFTVTHAINFFLSIRRLILVTGHFPRFRCTIKGALCCGASLVAVGLLPVPMEASYLHMVFFGGAYLTLFFTLCLLTGAIEKEDAGWLRRLVKNETQISPLRRETR